MQTQTRPGRRQRHAWLAAVPAAAVAALALAGPAAAGPSTSTVDGRAAIAASAPGAVTQGIIMRDGGICDPIRHMGC